MAAFELNFQNNHTQQTNPSSMITSSFDLVNHRFAFELLSSVVILTGNKSKRSRVKEWRTLEFSERLRLLVLETLTPTGKLPSSDCLSSRTLVKMPL